MSKVTLTQLGLSSDDLTAIGKLSEKGLTPDEIADSIEKIHSVNSSASEIDKTVEGKRFNGFSKLSLPSKGVIVHIGDSNTVARPAYRTAYEKDWFGTGGCLEGWTSWNIAANGSTADGWAKGIDTKDQNASPVDYGFADTSDTNIWMAVNAKPDIIIFSLGTNDFRVNYTDAKPDVLRADIKKCVDFLLDNTDATIIMRMPPLIAYQNPDIYSFTDCISSLDAKTRSENLRTVYLEYNNYSNRVAVIDLHKLVFGLKADTVSEPQDIYGYGDLQVDTLHLTNLGYIRSVQAIAHFIDNSIPNRVTYKNLGKSKDATPIYLKSVWSRTFKVVAKGDGYLQIRRNFIDTAFNISPDDYSNSLKSIPLAEMTSIYSINQNAIQEINRLSKVKVYFHETGVTTDYLTVGQKYDFPSNAYYQVNITGLLSANSSTGLITMFVEDEIYSPYSMPRLKNISIPLFGTGGSQVLSLGVGSFTIDSVRGIRDSASGAMVVDLYYVNQLDGRYVDGNGTFPYPGKKIGTLTFGAGYRNTWTNKSFVVDATNFPSGLVPINWNENWSINAVISSGTLGGYGNITIKVK